MQEVYTGLLKFPSAKHTKRRGDQWRLKKNKKKIGLFHTDVCNRTHKSPKLLEVEPELTVALSSK